MAVAPVALLSGLVTGSNVGSNAALMPVQVALGAAAGLPPLADGTRPAQLWRRLAPSMLVVLGLGWAGTWLLLH